MAETINALSIKQCQGDIARYLSQFDSHVHSFSHCVSVSRKDVPWDDKETGLDYRLAFIRNSLSLIYETAKNKEIKVQAVTEHPQFLRYEIPFLSYLQAFNEVRSRYRNYFAALPLGLEVEIKKNASGVYIDWDEISDGALEPMDIVKNIDVLVFSMHHKYFRGKNSALKSSSDFVDTVKHGLEKIAEFKDEVRKRRWKERVCILGHPWDVSARTNQRAWKKSAELQTAYPDYEDYLRSSDVQISFLSTPKLRELSDALLSAEVFPEINAHSIEEGRSDIRAGRFPKFNIVQAYIAYCIEKKKKPVISVGTDDHKIKGIGSMQLDIVIKKIKQLEKARVWCEQFQ